MKTKNIIRVAYACNDNFLLGMCTSAKSIIENLAKDDFLEIYVLYNEKNLCINNRKLIEDTLKDKKCKIIFVPVDCQKYNNFYIRHNDIWTVEIFYRMSIAELLPNVEKIIYLDSDTITLTNISELYNIDINEYYLAAVKDPMLSDHFHKFCKDINLKEYFNSGVLLLNLNKFRENNIFEKFQKFAQEKKDIILYPDQDIMNAVLRDKVKFISKTWNTMQVTWDYINAKKNGVNILHFTLLPKPWNLEYDSKNRKYFFKYFNKLPLSFIVKNFYWPNRKILIKKLRKKIIWYQSSQKILIIFSIIKIKLPL